MPTQPFEANLQIARRGEIDRRALMPVLAGGVAFLMLRNKARAQQVAIAKTASEVPGPPPGTTMTKEYVQMVGRMAYLWGWPLVNSHNRRVAFGKAPELGLLGGVVPAAPIGQVAMLTGYIQPDQTFITCPNQ